MDEVVDKSPEPKTCPKCGMKMLLIMSGVARSCYPAQHGTYFWCGCGHKEAGPWIRESESSTMDTWKRLNGIGVDETREKAEDLPEPWRSTAMGMQQFFHGPITVLVRRIDGKIVEISDAMGPLLVRDDGRKVFGTVHQR